MVLVLVSGIGLGSLGVVALSDESPQDCSSVEAELPQMPKLPTLSSDALDCLSDEAYNKLKRRDQILQKQLHIYESVLKDGGK
jgi:hypothetical protein